VKEWQRLAPTGWAAAARRVLLRPGTALLATVLLGLVVRCLAIESHELQYDEAATGYFSALPWRDLWGSPAVLEPNPPLFYSLASMVTLAHGTPEQIRYVSAITGALCIALAWLVAHDLAGGFAAAGAALLVALSPQDIAISRYARAYSLLVLLLMCAFYCLQRVRPADAAAHDRRHALSWWSDYAMASTAALYTHHTAIVVLAALNLCVLPAAVGAGHAHRRFLVQWLVANLVVAALYAPWLPVFFGQVHPAAATSSSAAAVHAAPPGWLWTVITNPYRFAGLPWIDVRLVLVILFGAWRFRRARGCLLPVVVCGVVMMVVASRFRPLLDGKTLAWAGLFATVAAAIGCSAAGRLRLPLLGVAVVFALPSVLTALSPAPEGWREVAAVLRENAGPQDVLYMNYPAAILPLRRYGWLPSATELRVFANRNEEPWFRDRTLPVVAPQAVAGEALQQIAKGKRVFVLDYGRNPPDVANEIAGSAIRALHRRTEKLDLSLFLPAAPAANGALVPSP
jgi:mannosyltransferase